LKIIHDLHLANQIIRTAQQYALKNGLEKISKIELELGSISEHGAEITPEGLKYNINLLLPNIKISIIEKNGGNYWKLVSIK